MSNVEQEILDNNRMIAEFMGWTIHYHPYTLSFPIPEPSPWIGQTDKILYKLASKFKYHSDWNELMEVVKRIEEDYAHLHYDESLMSSLKRPYDIDEVYTEVVTFVISYQKERRTP